MDEMRLFRAEVDFVLMTNHEDGHRESGWATQQFSMNDNWVHTQTMRVPFEDVAQRVLGIQDRIGRRRTSDPSRPEMKATENDNVSIEHFNIQTFQKRRK